MKSKTKISRLLGTVNKESVVPKTLIRRIPAKRLRAGWEPDDVVVNVVGLSAPASPEQHTHQNVVTVLYEVFADGVKLALERMEDVEGRFGPESVFEDRIGTCFVALTAFGQHQEGKRSMARRHGRGLKCED